MRILSLIAHPRPSSFCHAISARAREALTSLGCTVIHHDLYAERFDPCLTADEAYAIGDSLEQAFARGSDTVIQQHRAEIAGVQGLLVVHPVWWGKPPAILSGWLDRVLVPGVAYRFEPGDRAPQGLLPIQTALILNTSDTDAARTVELTGDPLELIWGKCVLPFCGVTSWHRQTFSPVADSSAETRGNWLAQAETLCRQIFHP